MAELDIEAIIARVSQASGPDGWEKFTYSIYMDGSADWHFCTTDEPICATCSQADAEFIVHVKKDIMDLLGRLNDLEIELQRANEDYAELAERLEGDDV